MSRGDMYRTLHARHLRPTRIQMWLHNQDADFRAKANRICKPYLNPPSCAAVASFDEKDGMHAIDRKHPGEEARERTPRGSVGLRGLRSTEPSLVSRLAVVTFDIGAFSDDPSPASHRFAPVATRTGSRAPGHCYARIASGAAPPARPGVTFDPSSRPAQP